MNRWFLDRMYRIIIRIENVTTPLIMSTMSLAVPLMILALRQEDQPHVTNARLGNRHDH